MATNGLKNSVFKKTGKVAKAVNAVLSVIPDTVAIVGKITDSTVPIVDKALDRRHEAKSALIQLPDVVDLSVTDAQEHLEHLGFVVHTVLAKPDKKYVQATEDEVVKMQPRSGKFAAGHLIKLYYADTSVIKASKDLVKQLELPAHLKGLPLETAQKLLEDQGFIVVKHLLAPKAELAQGLANHIIETHPKQYLFAKTVKPGTIIRLDYMDEASLIESQQLLKVKQEKNKQLAQTVNNFVKQSQDFLNKKK